MRNFTSLVIGSLLLVATASCKHTAAPSTACPDVLVGTWYLTNRVPVPKTDETIILTANNEYSVFRDGLLSAQGTYAVSQDQCGSGTAVPFLKFTPATPGMYAPNGAYTLRDCTLVIEQCQNMVGTTLTYRHPVD
jgi:hypothetical protein